MVKNTDMAELKTELARSNPSRDRIVRKIGAISEVLAGAVAEKSMPDEPMISITRQAVGLLLATRNHWREMT